MDAEDLVQDAFVAVRRAYFDKTVDELRPLLFTTLRNLTLNYLKSGNTRRRQASVELSDMDDRLSCPRTVTPEIQLIDAIVCSALPSRQSHRWRRAAGKR